MTEPKKYHCVSCLATARAGDDIKHELNCPNLATAHNPDVSRVSYSTKTFTVQSTDPQVALATVSMWECDLCGALVDEQWRHTRWHISEAMRFYELQRRTNRVRVKRPKGRAPLKKGRVPKTMPKNSPLRSIDNDSKSESEQPTDAPTESQRRKVKGIVAPRPGTHTVPEPLSEDVFTQMSNDIRKVVREHRRDVITVAVSEAAVARMYIIAEEQRSDTTVLRLDGTRLESNPMIPTAHLWGIPITLDETLAPHEWRIDMTVATYTF